MTSDERWMSRICHLLLALCLVAGGQAVGAETWGPVTPKTKLKIGDKVQVNVLGQWQEGEIVGSLPGGMIRLNVRDPMLKGQTMPYLAAPGDLRVRVVRPADKVDPFDPEKGFRTWEDNTGKHKIEAKLIGVRDGAVRLERRDGREVTVPLDRLSEKDVRLLKRSRPGMFETEKPAATAGTQSGESMGEGPGPGLNRTSQEPPPAKEANWADAQPVDWMTGGKPSGLTPDSGPPMPKLGKKPILLPLNNVQMQELRRFQIVDAAPQRVLITFNRRTFEHELEPAILGDLKNPSPRTTMGLVFPPGMAPVDISPSGELVLTTSAGAEGWGHSPRLPMDERIALQRSRLMRMRGRPSLGGERAEDGSAEKKKPERLPRVDVWRVSRNGVEHQFGWSLWQGEELGFFAAEAPWAVFVDSEHVLTHYQGKLVLWNAPEARAVYTAEVYGGIRPAISPGRKYAAVPVTPGNVFVLETKTGEVKGRYEGADGYGGLSFRPDGRQLAMTEPNRILIWDFASGKLVRDMGLLRESTEMDPLYWVSDRYVLVAGGLLVDLDMHITLGDYGGIGFSRILRPIGGQIWAVTNQLRGCYLAPVELPDAAAKKRAEELRQDDMVAIRPGDTVSVEVNSEVPDVDREEIAGILKGRLESRGLKIAEGRPFKFLVEIRYGPKCKVEYRWHDPKKLLPPSQPSGTPGTSIPGLPAGFDPWGRTGAGSGLIDGTGNPLDISKWKPLDPANPRPFGVPPIEDRLKQAEVVQQVEVQQRIVLAGFAVHNNLAWFRLSIVRPPPVISMSEGKRIEDVVAKEMEIDPGWFRRIGIPRTVGWPLVFLKGGTPRKEP